MTYFRRLVARAVTRGMKKSRQPRAGLWVEALEDRVALAMFAPTLFSDGVTGSTLRAAILTANGNTQDDIIQLQAGTYDLSIGNTSGQENSASEGDLDILSDYPVGQTVTIQGAGRNITFINAHGIDRVFQVIGGNVTLILKNLTITGGVARDDGTSGALPGTTDALGGAILHQGDVLTLDTASIDTNTASGGNGATSGASGFSATGGGIYFTGSSLTINKTFVFNNKAFGGNGAQGADAIAGSADATSGGGGGAANGGGLYASGASGATVTIFGGSLSGNEALGGTGAAGGNGVDSTTVSQRNGSKGGSGGLAEGGAAKLLGFGSITVHFGAFDSNKAVGGAGGAGGIGATSASLGGGIGGDGGFGGTGGAGALFVSGGANTSFDLSNSDFIGNAASGGVGGVGGVGGSSAAAITGGKGGSGQVGGGAFAGALFVETGTGSVTSVTDVKMVFNRSSAGAGGVGGGGGSVAAGSGGAGGAGGAGGDGGLSQAGGLYIQGGDLTIIRTNLSGNTAAGGSGAGGGTGGSGGSSAVNAGGKGGHGGAGGAGGKADGGGGFFQLSGALKIQDSSVDDNSVTSGSGGPGGRGGQGGARSIPDGTAGAGGSGGQGGLSKSASAAGISMEAGSYSIVNTSFSGNVAATGLGGAGGQGGSGGASSVSGGLGVGGSGGVGGTGGGTGTITGGVLSVSGGSNFSLQGSTFTNNTSTTGIGGAGGQGGIGGAGGLTIGHGGQGGAGGSVGTIFGGALFIFETGVVQIATSTIDRTEAAGGEGGRGGNGGAAPGAGDAGAGGTGGSTGDVNGAGIYAFGGSTFKITDSTLSRNSGAAGAGGSGGNGGNSAAGSGGVGGTGGAGGKGFGGGLFLANFDTAQIVQSTISTNQTVGGKGGFGGSGGSGSVEGPGGSGASAGTARGGGVLVDADGGVHLHIFNSTIAFNSAFGSLGGGGGVGAPPGSPAAPSSSSGGGIYSTDQDGDDADDIEIESSIIAKNVANDGTDIFGDLDSYYSFLGVDDAGAEFASIPYYTITNQDPLLGPLEDNGGPTETHQLQPDSQAIDAGSNPLGLIFDQRGAGFPRTKGTQTDMGALESSAVGIIVVGADTGDVPNVRVFQAHTGNLLLDFMPYSSRFLGGVRAAAADFNGDGVKDFIVGTGPGLARSFVRVMDGSDPTQLLFEFAPFGSHYNKGVYVAAGDVDGDGTPDVIVGAGRKSSRVVVISGADPHDKLRDFYAFAKTFRGGVRVAAGDFNGDETDDIVVTRGGGGTAHVRIFDGDSNQLLHDFIAFDNFLNGLFIAVGDLDGDGVADIVVGQDAGGSGQVKVFDGADLTISHSFTPFASFTGAIRVGVTDADGDGLPDIIAARGPLADPRVKVFDGMSFDEIVDFLAHTTNFSHGLYVGG